jgi:hypothetical protein
MTQVLKNIFFKHGAFRSSHKCLIFNNPFIGGCWLKKIIRIVVQNDWKQICLEEF